MSSDHIVCKICQRTVSSKNIWQHRKSKICLAAAAEKAKKAKTTIDLSRDDETEKPSESIQLIATEVASIVTARQAAAAPAASVASVASVPAPVTVPAAIVPVIPIPDAAPPPVIKQRQRTVSPPPSSPPPVMKRRQRPLSPPPSPPLVMKRRRSIIDRGDCEVCGHLFCESACPRRKRASKDEDHAIRLDQMNMKLNVIMDMLREIYRDFP